MVATGDWVTLHVDGVRYLEKAPLPYWIAAVSLKMFGAHAAFAIHLPIALTALALALLGYSWSRRAFGDMAALLTAIFTLTCTGTFLFTRIFIPDALLSLLLAAALYSFLLAMEPAARRRYAYCMWASIALAVLTKGPVALVLFFVAIALYMAFTGELRDWRRLQPVAGLLLFMAIAAPWHVLAALRNTGGSDGHGFLWFYFINEQVLRFLGRRIPRDYNKLPTALYWSLHLVWLFPWSAFAPFAIRSAWRGRRRLNRRDVDATLEHGFAQGFAKSFAQRTRLLLGIFSAVVLFFFSLSTNQEYYTFPVYLPLLMLIADTLAPQMNAQPRGSGIWIRRSLTVTYAALFLIGIAVAAALAWGLWSSRHLAFVPDIGALLAHRGIGDYTFSMSHFFDLTGPSFAALRLPAMVAAIAFAIGPAFAWFLHARGRALAAVMAVALTNTVFLIAAHVALLRFAPMLSSAAFAQTIDSLEHTGRVAPGSEVLLFGDQAYGSSIPFYLQHRVFLVDGNGTSLLFGSSFADAPPLFLTRAQLVAEWGTGPRKVLFVPAELRDQADSLLGSRKILLQETSGKVLYTDRPLDTPQHALTDDLRPTRD